MIAQRQLSFNETVRLQIRSNAALLYNASYGGRSTITADRVVQMQAMREANRYSGKVTDQSRRRIKRAIQIMMQLAQPQLIHNPVIMKDVVHRLSFITLTVSSDEIMLTAAQAYKSLLRPFIQWLTKTIKVTTYIWKAELQKRGQIHYHITTPSWIHYRLIRDKWNYLQKKAGLLNQYFKEHNHYNANSTDIHEVYKVENLEAYLEKYMAKAESEKDATTGKVWDCSYNLKGVKYFSVDLRPEHCREIVQLADQQKATIVDLEHSSFIRLTQVAAKSLLYGYEHKLYDEWLQSVKERKRNFNKSAITKKKRLSLLALSTQLQFDYGTQITFQNTFSES